VELFQASQQWSTRPDDERFTSLQDAEAATRAYAQTAGEKSVPWSELRAEAIDSDVQLAGKAGLPARLTHWAFSQLAGRVEAPADYLRRLPATLAVQNLNHGLKERDASNGPAQLLFHQNGGLLCRAITSDRYSRIWNWEVFERLSRLHDLGWEPATPDVNDYDDPNDKRRFAIYASDHDMFVFLRTLNAKIAGGIGGEPLYRGCIVENSEVGAAALKLTRFYYDRMCGNHIIWNASKVVDLSLRHVGHIRDQWFRWSVELRRYAQETGDDDALKIATAKTVQIAATKEEVLDKLFGIRSLQISRKALEAGYEAVKPAEDGDPRTVWGMVQGITRHSQTMPYADKRNDLDRAAGRLMAVNF